MHGPNLSKIYVVTISFFLLRTSPNHHCNFIMLAMEYFNIFSVNTNSFFGGEGEGGGGGVNFLHMQWSFQFINQGFNCFLP